MPNNLNVFTIEDTFLTFNKSRNRIIHVLAKLLRIGARIPGFSNPG
jgi:hypothetical protein